MRFNRPLTTTLAGMLLTLGVLSRPALTQDVAPAVAGQARQTAAAGQPAALLSITSLDRLLGDVSYMLRACNVPEVGGLVSVMANQYTQGLDRTRPLGLVLTMQGSQPIPLGFLPIKDRAAFFDALAAIGVEPDNLGDGLYEIGASGSTIFVKESNGWLFISQSEENLAVVPADPASLLGDLPNRYDLAVKVNLQALPAELRDMVSSQMRDGFERGLDEQRGQSAEEKKAAREMGEASLAQLEQMMRETEQLILGWAIDAAGQKTYVDGAAQFVNGGQYANQMEAAKNAKTAFSGFKIPGAAVSFRATSLISDSDKALAKNNIKNSMQQVEDKINEINDAQVRDTVLKLTRGLVKIVNQTIDEGSLDGAMSVSVADGKLRMLVGGNTADGNALAKEVQDAVQSLSGIPEVPKFEFNYANHGGMTLHRTSIPIQSNDPNVRAVFGNELKLTIGTANKAFALSLDPDGDATLKAAIDSSKAAPSAAATPMEGVIEIGQLIQFAQSVSPNSILDNVLQTVQQYAGKDRVLINGNLIPRGIVYRFSLDEGVLRAIGTAAKSGSNGGGF
jgi:hypothetical protein